MKMYSIKKFFFYLLSIIILTVCVKSFAETNGEGNVLTLAEKLGSCASPNERAQVLGDMINQYDELKKKLLENLFVSIKNHRNNYSYNSPLHSAILAIQTWRVYEADGNLLELIDYTLDRSTAPAGILLMGDSFYPATRALLALRVDPEKVISTITKAKTDLQLRLLSWVLWEREKSKEDTIYLLTLANGKYMQSSEKQNIANAIKWIQKSGSSSDLLSPSSSQNTSK